MPALRREGAAEPGSRVPQTGFIFQIKKLCRRKGEGQVCVVYEDMSCSHRSNVSSSNPYQ